MKRARIGRFLCFMTFMLLAIGSARADWLATDPGTPISLQINSNGTLVVRPLSGTWSHPLCSDVSAAVLKVTGGNVYAQLLQTLTIAAATGSLVNLYAVPDKCHGSGFPFFTAVRVQAP